LTFKYAKRLQVYSELNKPVEGLIIGRCILLYSIVVDTSLLTVSVVLIVIEKIFEFHKSTITAGKPLIILATKVKIIRINTFDILNILYSFSN